MAASILDGTDEIIDRWLGLDESWAGKFPRYKHKSTLLRLPAENDLDGEFLSRSILDRITENWKGMPVRRKPSQKNWRFAKQLDLAPDNSSVEKTLEKSIAFVAGDDWANQVPVASGLVGRGEGQRAIDLVHMVNGTCKFVELKTDENSGGPLFAAIEILLYGLLYVFSRQNSEELGYSPTKKLLRAERIELQVLAPTSYYQNYELDWLETSLSSGLSTLCEELAWSMDFCFRAFPKDFAWRAWNVELWKALCSTTKVCRE